MDICLVRHGETDWNALGKLQGLEDVPMNENGRRQVERAAELLRGRRWRAVFTSPLKRARQTAEILATSLLVDEIYEDAGLVERDYGRASGLSVEQVRSLFPDGRYEGQEDWSALRDRVVGAVVNCAGMFPDGDIIVVSHGGAINALLAELSNHTIGTGVTWLKNACVSMLSYSDGNFSIVYYNRSADD